MERRKHNRIRTSIPVKIHVKMPESEVSWNTLGFLDNVSYGGVYFRCTDTLPLEQGQIRDFTITPTIDHPDFPGTPLITGMGRVVRIDPPQTDLHGIGVALELISATFFDFRIK